MLQNHASELIRNFCSLWLLRALLVFNMQGQQKKKNLIHGFCFSVVVSDMAQLTALWMSVAFVHGVAYINNFNLLQLQLMTMVYLVLWWPIILILYQTHLMVKGDMK